MQISLSKILERAEGMKNPVVVFDARLVPRWAAWMLNRIYGAPLSLEWYMGDEIDGKVIIGASTWTYTEE